MSRTADTDTLIKQLVESLVDEPGDVDIARSESDTSISYKITVNPDDVGKVIGRQGRIIKAIRTVMRAAGSVNGEQVNVDVLG
jgi:predicted RNA-binding protein YlqC (UPF0109 family)